MLKSVIIVRVFIVFIIFFWFAWAFNISFFVMFLSCLSDFMLGSKTVNAVFSRRGFLRFVPPPPEIFRVFSSKTVLLWSVSQIFADFVPVLFLVFFLFPFFSFHFLALLNSFLRWMCVMDVWVCNIVGLRPWHLHRCFLRFLFVRFASPGLRKIQVLELRPRHLTFSLFHPFSVVFRWISFVFFFLVCIIATGLRPWQL